VNAHNVVGRPEVKKGFQEFRREGECNIKIEL
jgi:hypothetical protein